MPPIEKRYGGLNPRPVISVFKKLKKEIQKTVAETVTSENKSASFIDSRLEKISNLMTISVAYFADYAKKEIPKTLKKSATLTEKLMRGISRIVPTGSFLQKSSSAIIIQAVNDIAQSSNAGKGRIEKLFSLIQRDPENPIREELEKSILDDGKIFTSSSGRSFTPEYYAEMVTRTRGRESQTAGAVATIKEFGQDLIQISSHGTQSEICKQYEGNVYSLSGNDSEFDLISEFPPFHVNCAHGVSPYVRSS